MVPEYNMIIDIDNTSVSNLTYRVDLKNKRIYGKINDIESVKQSVFKILSTERQSNVIYDVNYGVELERFIGIDKDFIISDIERTITDALTVDDRITGISNFTANEVSSDTLYLEFIVETVYGDIKIESEVMI